MVEGVAGVDRETDDDTEGDVDGANEDEDRDVV